MDYEKEMTDQAYKQVSERSGKSVKISLAFNIAVLAFIITTLSTDREYLYSCSWIINSAAVILIFGVTFRFVKFCFIPLRLLEDIIAIFSKEMRGNQRFKRTVVVTVYRYPFHGFLVKGMLVGLQNSSESPLLGCIFYLLKLIKTLLLNIGLSMILLKVSSSDGSNLLNLFSACTLAFLFKDSNKINLTDLQNIIISSNAYLITLGSIFFGVTIYHRLKNIQMFLGSGIEYYKTLIEMTETLKKSNISITKVLRQFDNDEKN